MVWVAKLAPPDEPRPRGPLFGYMAGTASIRGDIVRAPTVEWAALSGTEDHLYAGLERAAPTSRLERKKPGRAHK